MAQKYFKKIIIPTILTVGIILMPLSFARKVEAQNISAYIGGALPAITQLPLCSDNLVNGVKNLFNGTNGLNYASGGSGGGLVGPPMEDGSFTTKTDQGVSSMNSVPTYDEWLNQTANENLALSKKIDENVNSLNENDTCLKSIGRLVIKMLLQKMTLATVDWINNGFNGGPAFVQDPAGFFNDIAKNEILQFGVEINNPELYPFGRAFMENQAMAFKSKFADNARYSLNEMIKSTTPEFSAQTFNEDFSQGGWDAWTYMTQTPANNPLGFQIMASNELQKRLEGTSQSTAQNVRDSLQQAGGFLGDIRCSADTSITQEDKAAALAEGKKDPCEELKGKWEYVTPGGMVAKAATDLIKYPDNNLLKADDLNDAVAAILDALINRFSGDIMSKGFSNFSGSTSASSGNFQLDENNQTNYGADQTSLDFSGFTIEASSWLKQNPNFNIRTDLKQALIDEQRTYIEKLTAQNKELNDLIKVTHQLDYCVPGPHPGWEEDSKAVLDETLGYVPPYAEGIDWVAKLATILDPSGITMGIRDFLTSFVGGASDEQNYNAGIINSFTGLKVDLSDTKKGKVATRQQVENVLNTIFERYAVIINQIYDQNPDMPLVTQEAKNEFLKIPGYKKIIEDSTKKINNLKGIVARLTNIKTQIDQLNYDLGKGLKNQTEYDTELTPLINSFGRLSADMVSGDNIANIDNIYKQAKDKKEYIYNDLLKGPEGCEQDLSTGQSIHLPWQFFNTKRMTYPFPLLYDYNGLKAGETIPDPWNSGHTNKMIPGTPVNNVGPGFLSYTHYRGDSVINYTGDLAPSQFPYLAAPNNHPGTLTLFENSNNANTPNIINLQAGNVNVGRNNCSDWTCGGRFETFIGIY